MKLLFDCRAMAKLLSASQDDAPPPVLRARMRLHLLGCRGCRNIDAQLRFVRRAMLELRLNAPRIAPTQVDASPVGKRPII